MLTLLGINKILAIYVGPTGYAALGQFQNAMQMITTLASGAINTGVTKYTAEYQNDDAQQSRLWQTAGTITLVSSSFLSLAVFIFSEQLAQFFLADSRLSTVFVWFSATLVLFVFNTLLLAILNGRKEIPRFVLANIAGSVLALVVTTFMVVNWHVLGALVALAVYQSLSFFVTLALCLKTNWFSFGKLVGRVDWNVAKNLAKYTAMALTTAATVPMSQILIRNHLGETLGWQAAGYWEAMWRLSSAYLMLASTTLSVYYLPKLSELKSSKEIKAEIMSGYRVILPVVILSASLVYALRELVIAILFSKQFAPMENLFCWQLIGDVLKIASWLFAYVMLARAMTKLFIVSEIFFAILFYVLSVYFTSAFGLNGVTVAYAVNYFVYLIFMAYVIRNKLEAVG